MKMYVLIFILLMIFKSCDLIKLPENKTETLGDFNYRENHFPTHLMQKRNDSNSECVKTINELLTNDFNMATFKFLDSWGKIPSGLLYGHLVDLGNFDECLSARKTVVDKEIRGKYFLTQAILLTNIADIFKTTADVTDRTRMTTMLDINMIGNPSITFGACFPHVCNAEEVEGYLQTSVQTIGDLWEYFSADNKLKSANTSMMPVKFHVRSSSTDKNDESSYDTVTILSISIFAIIGFLMVLSSCYEYFMTQTDVPPNQLLISFSIFTNGRKLFHINTQPSGNSIDCLGGIRVISMMWVIYGHSYAITSSFPLINSFTIVDWMKSPKSMLLQAATISVDSFLVMSGILLAWVALPKIEKAKGRLNIPLMYFHRYIRLTPVLAATILFVIGIVPLLVEGPFAQNFEETFGKSCHKYWWSTLLYVNNYVHPGDMCIGHSWYLAVDTQLFLISPIILLGLWKWKSKFLWIMLVLAALSYGCCISTMFTNNFNGILLKGFVNPVQFVRIYFPTHIRMSPWLIGMGFGYWLHQNRTKKPKLSSIQIFTGWTLAIAVWMAVIFGPYHLAANKSDATVLEAALYEAFGRSAWSIGLIWIIFVCHTGNSRTIDALLSHPGWQPFVRLTYTMYIISYVLQNINAANVKTDKYFSTYSMIQSFWAEFGVILSISIIVVLAFESPMIAIEKYFFTPIKPKEDKETIIEEGGKNVANDN